MGRAYEGAQDLLRDLCLSTRAGSSLGIIFANPSTGNCTSIGCLKIVPVARATVLLFTSPGSSSHVLRATRICTDSGTPYASLISRIAAARSSSMANLINLRCAMAKILPKFLGKHQAARKADAEPRSQLIAGLVQETCRLRPPTLSQLTWLQ